MNYKNLEKIILAGILTLAGVVYLLTVAPTVSFWDCGEFISSCFTLAVPHPPGTPLFIVLGKVWLMITGALAAFLPISREVSWHMNLLGISFTLAAAAMVYKLILKIIRLWRPDADQLKALLIAGAAATLLSFSFTFWDNALETEVYSAATFLFLFINYLVLLWYESVRNGTPKNRYILLAFYLIFLFTGIQLIPFLIFIPLYVFIFAVDRRYLKDWLLICFGVFQAILFGVMFVIPASRAVLIMLALPVAVGLGLILYQPRRYHNWKFFLAGVFLVIVAVTTELYLPIRSKVLDRLYRSRPAREQYLTGKNIAPRINENDPGESWTAFDMVLHRAQYGPQKIYPRKTQEETGYNPVLGYFWQMAMMVRYLSWQVAPEDINRLFRAVLVVIFYLAGIAGIFRLYKFDRKIFLMFMVIMFMLSFAIVGYLNMKFSPSDYNPAHKGHEVRERDYFFHTGFTYFVICAGFGFYSFLEWLKREAKGNRLAHYAGLGGIAVFSIAPLFTNLHVNNRYKNFAPKDYGYNLLRCCDDGAILFTNGDNDTFPLWFAQEVLGIKRSVINANLSLINTDWYIRQLKDWGAPITFSDYTIKRLEPAVTEDRRIVYVKDIMIREILAANEGITLPDADYYTSGADFAAKYLKGYHGKQPIYFATTVSPDNFEGFLPYLRIEGIVYRVVGDSIPYPGNIDVERTRDFFFRDCRYTGIFGPEKQREAATILEDFDQRKKAGEFYNFEIVKDENTRILYANYQIELYNLGLVLKAREDYRDAIKAWRLSTLFEAQENYPMLFYIGYTYAEMGLRDSADSYFERIRVNNPGLNAKIGLVYNEISNYDRAIEYFQRALTQNPRIPEAYMGLITAYLGKGDTNSALGILGEWVKANPRDTSALNLMRRLKKGG
jgi:tetratricopeptide (TPR) repeat protein